VSILLASVTISFFSLVMTLEELTSLLTGSLALMLKKFKNLNQTS
jgi:hypothetical protein